MAKGKYKDWLTEEGLLKIEGWARDGLTDKQISSNIGVSERTFTDWKKNHSAISSVLKKGKEVVDIQVENALLKRALGYGYTERTAKVVDRDKELVSAERREYENRYKIDHPDSGLQDVKDAAIKAVPTTERIVILEVDKQQAPDTTAAIFWLKNRKPNEWRDKRETQISGDIGVRNPMQNLTEEELRRLANGIDGT